MASFQSNDIAPDDVVISGIGGTFPQSEHLEEFEMNLFHNTTMVHEINNKVWNQDKCDVPCVLGTIKNKCKFDSLGFGISDSHATEMDQAIWKMLENTFAALVDSGQNPLEFSNRNTSVIMATDRRECLLRCFFEKNKSHYKILGSSLCMLSNRISFWLNTKGSSITINAEGAAGVSVLQMAVDLIKNGHCDDVITGAVNLIDHPGISSSYKTLGTLSSDGECRAFDADGTGYGRSEACVVLYLQKAKYAKRVYSTVVHVQSLFYGHRNAGLVRPVSDNILELLERFYEKTGVDPAQVCYLESSANGIKEYEQSEFEAVSKVLLRNRRYPLLTGSVKSNMGHAGSASLFCSVIKLLIAIQRGVIPANLHFNTPGLHIPGLAEGNIKVVTENTKWNPDLSAVNTLDCAGNFGHVLLRPYKKGRDKFNYGNELPRLVCMSGRSEEGTQKNLQKLGTMYSAPQQVKNMELNIEFIRLVQDVYSKPFVRNHYRGYMITSPTCEQVVVEHYDGGKRPVWFVFSGMGSQWPGMGKGLMELPVIAETLKECHRILQPKGVDLLNILTTDDPSIFDNILHSFVGIAAIQIALVETLKLLKIEPDGIIGHSLGELGCAYADGCFTIEQMILAAYYRGMASLEAELIPGRMAAIGLGYKQVNKLVPTSVDVACHNSKTSSTISGPSADVSQFVSEMQSQNTFAKEVNVANIAFHSRYIKPASSYLLNYLRKVIPEPRLRSSRWYCTSSPEEMWDSPEVMYSSAEYHTNNLLNPVLFEETCRHIPNNAILIEIAPRGLMQAILKRSMGTNCVNVPLCDHRKQNSVEFLLSAIGKLFLAGLDLQISVLYPNVTFPVSSETPSLSSLTSWDYSRTFAISVSCAEEEMTKNITIDLMDEEFHVLKGYMINGENVLPISAILVVLWKALAAILSQNVKKLPVVFEDLSVLYLLKLKTKPLELKFNYQGGSKTFDLIECGKDKQCVKGKLRTEEDMIHEFSAPPLFLEDGLVLASNDIYTDLESKGYSYGEQFHRLQKVTLGKKGSKALVDWSDNWIVRLESLFQLPALQSVKYGQNIEFPMFIKKVVIDPVSEAADHKKNVSMAQFCIFTNTVYCGTVLLRGIQLKEVILENVSKVKVTHMEFYPYRNAHYQTSDEFISNAIQLTLDNILNDTNNAKTLTLLVNGDTTEIFEKEIEDLVKKIKFHKVVLRKLSVVEKGNTHQTVVGSLILASDATVSRGTALLKNIDGFLLAKIRENYDLKLHEDLVIVDEQCFQSKKYLLIKKYANLQTSDDVVFLPKLELLFSKEIFHKDRKSKTYIVAKSSSLDEVKAFVAEVTEKIYYPRSFRFIFLLDGDAPPFSLTDKFYLEQLKLDFVMNIYHNGTWEGLKHVELENQLISPSETLCNIISVLRIKDIHWDYLGINWRNSQTAKKEGNILGVLDVSGTAADGQRVMCLARLNTGSLQVTTDPYFTWLVPDSWSLEDAATVPFTYSLAYYTLVFKAAAKCGQNILVHAGHTPVGQAFIAVALKMGLQVFTTICDKHEQYIRAKFPQIPVSHIFYLNDKLFAKKISNNYGNIFEFVVNLLEEPLLQMSLNLLPSWGSVLQLCTTDMEVNKELGMEVFLRAINLVAVIPEQIFEINPAWKECLYKMIEDGIRTNKIRPMDREVFSTENDILSSIYNVELTHKALVTKSTLCGQQITDILTQKQKICKSKTLYFFEDKTSCFIISDTPEDSLTMAEWLVSRGCCYLTICCNCSALSYLTSRRLQLLISRYNVHVDIVPLDKLNSCAYIVDLLHSNNNTAPLSAVFVLPVKNMSFLHFLHMGLEETGSTTFVLLMNCCDIPTVTNMRKSGLKVLILKRSSELERKKLWPLFDILDKILLNDCSDTLRVAVNESAAAKGSFSTQHLSLLLPTSTEQLEDLGEDLILTAACSLEEVCTMTPRTLYVREVLPVYIITGFQGPAKSCAQELAYNLMCPAFVVKIPGGSDSIYENVTAIIKAIRRVQSEGPYNLVGISCGGVYTIELAKQLQAEGEKTQVFLIDGAPQTCQDIAKLLGDGDQQQVNLLKETLNITSDEVCANLLEQPTWDFRLERALLEIIDNSTTRKRHMSFALDSIYRKICNINSYMPGRELLSGNVTLFRPKILSSDDTCGLGKFFKERANVVVVEADYSSLLKNTKIADVISDMSLVNLYWKKDQSC